jgi:DNA replication and repair protein RecF
VQREVKREAQPLPAPGTDAVRLESVTIRDYRNLERVDVAIPPEGAVLIGDNGHGKTNFLEAVYYMQILRPVRGARDADAVRFGSEAFHVRASVDGSPLAREISVGYERQTRRKLIRLDGVAIERLVDAVGALPGVLFSPDQTCGK